MPHHWWQPTEENKYVRIFNCLLSICLLHNIIMVPVITVFPYTFSGNNVWFWLQDILWLFDILLNFFLIQADILNQNPKKIALAYLQSAFLFDLGTVLATMISQQSQIVQWVRFLRILWRINSLFYPVKLVLRKIERKSRRRRSYMFVC